MTLSRLLRFALLTDAVATASTGALMLFASGVLEPWLGLPATLLRYAGAVLLPYAAMVGVLGGRARAPRAAIWTIIACNAAWAVDSVILLATGWTSPTPLGYAFVLAQATVVALFAQLQLMGLRQSPAAMAAA